MNKENTNPLIKCGYCEWLINDLQNVGLLEHSCFAHFNEEEHLLYIDNNNVASLVEKDQSTVCSDAFSDYNEALVSAVYARPALYNHRIPLKERTNLKKQALWNEIAKLLGGNENDDVDFIKKRWKQLRDSYVKAKKKENSYLPSGSSGSAKNDKMTFALYNQMKFLDDITGKSSTVTSLPVNISECPTTTQPTTSTTQRIPLPQGSAGSTSADSCIDISDTTIDDFSATKEQSLKKRKVRGNVNDDNTDIGIRKAIIASIEESKSTPDAVDGFFLQIGHRLRALPPRQRAQFEIKILTDLFELENSLSLH